MTAQKIFNTDVSTDLTDILFEHRNKAYGAYVLRKQYDERVNKSMLITMSIFLLFFLLTLIFTSHQSLNLAVPKTQGPVVDFGKKLNLPPANTQKKTTTLPAKPAAPKPVPDKNDIQLVNQNLPPVVKPDSNKTDELKTNAIPLIGVPAPGSIPAAPSSPGGSDGTPSVKPTKPVIIADIMPQFPGGKEALERYLKKHIQFTPIAIDAGVEGKVYISFVVDVDGSIQNVKILGDKVGYGCAQIAVDVIKNMPTWTPGSNNGHLVPVQMMQPIDFQR